MGDADLEKAVWVLLKITEVKSTPAANREARIYYEMCDSSEKKVAGAITVPVKPHIQIPNFKTVILSTLDTSEAAETLRKAGQQL